MMANHVKPARPANRTAPNDGEASHDGFLLEVNQRVFTRWFHGMNALSREIAQFTQNRLQEDMAAWSTLAGCNSPEVAFECQRRFAQQATAGYVAEVAKLSQMMVSLASEGLESHQRGAGKAS